VKNILLLVMLFFSISVYAQNVSVNAFPGVTVGEKLTNAQNNGCSADLTVTCVLNLDPVLSVFSAGTFPAICARCTWVDYRTPGVVTFSTGVNFGSAISTFNTLANTFFATSTNNIRCLLPALEVCVQILLQGNRALGSTAFASVGLDVHSSGGMAWIAGTAGYAVRNTNQNTTTMQGGYFEANGNDPTAAGGTVTEFMGAEVVLKADEAFTITDASGLLVREPSLTGPTVGSLAGVRVLSQGAGATQFSWVSGTGDMQLGDRLDHNNFATFTNLDTTPSVAAGNMFNINNGGATTITALDDGVNGQVVYLLCVDAITVFTDGGTLFLAGGFTCTANDTLTLVFNGTNWFELDRSVN